MPLVAGSSLSACTKAICKARVTLIKVPRGNELFAGFPAGAFHVFTKKHVTGSKAFCPVGFSPFSARHASVEVRYRSNLSFNLNAKFRSFWIHFTVTPVAASDYCVPVNTIPTVSYRAFIVCQNIDATVVWLRSFIPLLLNSNNGNQNPVLQWELPWRVKAVTYYSTSVMHLNVFMGVLLWCAQKSSPCGGCEGESREGSVRDGQVYLAAV